MSVLNQLFNRGLIGAKCKTCLTLAISRMKLLQNKRDIQLKLMKKEIAQFLLAGQEVIARIRVEHVIREQNTYEAYEILELFCEFILARIPILESQGECPAELQEAVATIIFSALRCSDLPDLLQVRNLLVSKYGKEFVAAASELRPDTSVNRTIIEKLSVSAPPAEVRLKVLKEIAKQHNVYWDSTKSETEFGKRHDDLLDGPKQIAVQPHMQSRKEIQDGSSCLNGMQSPSDPRNTSVSSSVAEQSSKGQNTILVTSSSSLDAMEKARLAIVAAQRATALARAAAALVDIDFPV